MDNITVTALLVPYPNAENPDIINGQPYKVARYIVIITNVDGTEGIITASMLYHDKAVELIKLAGIPLKDARKLVDDASLDALMADIRVRP